MFLTCAIDDIGNTVDACHVTLSDEKWLHLYDLRVYDERRWVEHMGGGIVDLDRCACLPMRRDGAKVSVQKDIDVQNLRKLWRYCVYDFLETSLGHTVSLAHRQSQAVDKSVAPA